MSAKCPVFIAPAMDLDMYAHPSTKKNLNLQKASGISLFRLKTENWQVG
jgi:phosphopantothenoylcysteine decarboxylase/phosphopantothenate--cysteine ligase